MMKVKINGFTVKVLGVEFWNSLPIQETNLLLWESFFFTFGGLVNTHDVNKAVVA